MPERNQPELGYLTKMKGRTESPTMESLSEIVWSWIGAVVMLAVAVLVNNIPKSRRYPDFWV